MCILPFCKMFYPWPFSSKIHYYFWLVWHLITFISYRYHQSIRSIRCIWIVKHTPIEKREILKKSSHHWNIGQQITFNPILVFIVVNHLKCLITLTIIRNCHDAWIFPLDWMLTTPLWNVFILVPVQNTSLP